MPDTQYVALVPLLIGTAIRGAGELIPEAETWHPSALHSLIETHQVGRATVVYVRESEPCKECAARAAARPRPAATRR